MTVEELIEKLKNFNPKAKVGIDVFCEDDYYSSYVYIDSLDIHCGEMNGDDVYITVLI